jgi:hypothetical protein
MEMKTETVETEVEVENFKHNSPSSVGRRRMILSMSMNDCWLKRYKKMQEVTRHLSSIGKMTQ